MQEKHEHDRLSDDGCPHPPLDNPSAAELAAFDSETVKLVMGAERLVSAAESEWEDLKGAASLAKKQAEARTFELRQLIREREQLRGKRPEPTLLDMVPAPAKWREVKIEDLPIPDGIKAHLSFEPVKTAGELFDQVTSFNPADGTPFGLPIGDVAEVRMKIQELIDAENREQPESATPAIPEDLWREYPLERWTRFGITDKDVAKLADGVVKRESGNRPLKTVGDLSNFTQPTSSGYTRQYADIKGIGPGGADRISDAETKFWAWWQGGGDAEFARERGLNAPVTGSSGGPDEADAGAADVDDAVTDPDPTDLYEETGGEG